MMKYCLILVLAFVPLLARGDSTCSDVDTQACELMMKSKPDLCNTSLGETACPRYCGMCPLECFSCKDLVQDMSLCTNVTTCDLKQTCYTAEIFDFDRSHGFAGGCISKEMCIPHRGELFGRSSSYVQTKCCDTDRCNGPSTTTTTTTTITTTQIPTTAIPTTAMPTTSKSSTHANCVDLLPNLCQGHFGIACAAFPQECRWTCGKCSLIIPCVIQIISGASTCSDIDTEACKLMATSQPDVCNSSIGETACRRYCGKCPLDCFSCPDLVQDMSQCTNIVTCSFNQLCVPQKGLLFGRSSSTVQIKCCDTDTCNGPIPLISTSISNTSSTTSQPVTHENHNHVHHYEHVLCHDEVDFCHNHPRLACIYTRNDCKKTCGLCCLTIVALVRISSADYVCADVNTDACKLMDHDQPGMCDTSIGDTACPRYCGKCPLECFSSSSLVQDLSKSNTFMCDVDQVCYSMEVTDFDQSHGFRGGCIGKEVCVPHAALTPQIFGRSSSTVHIQCCDTDRCNGQHNATKQTQSTKATTTSPLTLNHAAVTTDDPHCKDLSSTCVVSTHCNPHYYYRCRKSCGRC